MNPIGGEREYAVRHFEKGRDALAHLAKGFEWDGKEGVLLPAYLCESMLRPFKDAGLNVEFYSIFWTPEQMGDFLDQHAHRWALLKNDLFGEPAPFEEEIALWSGTYDNPVILDATMSIMSNHIFDSNWTYLFASLKKTTLINGAIVCDRSIMGMDYIHNLQETLEPESTERVSNIGTLRDKIRTVETANRNGLAWYGVYRSGVVPSHAAFQFNSHWRREKCRQTLIENGIYATVHWELPKEVEPWRFPKEYDLSRKLLSIPIDGRYGEDDMLRIVKVLKGGKK